MIVLYITSVTNVVYHKRLTTLCCVEIVIIQHGHMLILVSMIVLYITSVTNVVYHKRLTTLCCVEIVIIQHGHMLIVVSITDNDTR